MLNELLHKRLILSAPFRSVPLCAVCCALLSLRFAVQVADLGMARFQESSEGHTMTQCLCVHTRLHLSSGKTVPAGSVRPGTRLLGRDGSTVSVLAAASAGTGTMYRVEHERAPGYTVTPNHLVTLRWGEGPRCVLVTALLDAPPGRDHPARRPRGAYRVCWWEMHGGRPVERRMPERHCDSRGIPGLDGGDALLEDLQVDLSDNSNSSVDDDALRCRAWEEFHVSVAAGGPGARALFRGDLVDIRADVLAEQAVWDIVTGGGGAAKQHRATGRRTTLRVDRGEEWMVGHERDAATSPIVPPVPARAHASPSFPRSRFDAHRTSAGEAVALPLAHSALEDGSWRAARPGDPVRLVVDLAPHRRTASGEDKQVQHLSRSLRNVDRVLAHLGVHRTGVVVASALPGSVCPRQDSDASSWAARAASLLDFGTDAVVACGPDAHARWMRADRIMSDVSQLRTWSTPDGRRYTSFTYAPPSSLSGRAASPPRRIAVWHAFDLREEGRLQHVVESFRSALGLPACPTRPAIDAWHSDGLRLRSVQAIHRPGQRFAAITVDGEHRFAIEGGILTHVSPCSQHTRLQQATQLQADRWMTISHSRPSFFFFFLRTAVLPFGWRQKLSRSVGVG